MPAGTAASGFPVRFQDSPPTYVSVPSGLLALAGSADVLAVGTPNGGATKVAKLIRYQPTGAIAQGFPKDLSTGSSNVVTRVYRTATDGQGNVFALLGIQDPANSARNTEVVLSSYTSDGALRAGYPLHLATIPGSGTSPPTGDDIHSLAVNDTGTIYLAGQVPKAGQPTSASLVIRRIPAK